MGVYKVAPHIHKFLLQCNPGIKTNLQSYSQYMDEDTFESVGEPWDNLLQKLESKP